MLLGDGAVRLATGRLGAGQRSDGLEREVRVHRARAVGDQEREVRALSRFASLGHETHAPAQSLANEVMVYGRDRERRRDRRMIGVRSAVAQDKNPAPILDCQGGGATELLESRFESAIAVANREERRKRNRLQARISHTPQRGHRLSGEHRLRDADLFRMLGSLLEQISLRPKVHRERHDELLSNRIDRGICHLREHLPEVRREQLRTLGQNREGGVVPHRSSRFLSRVRHRTEHHLQLVGRIPERVLSNDERHGRLRL